jgi:outer membrane lipoprotein carrier protein
MNRVQNIFGSAVLIAALLFFAASPAMAQNDARAKNILESVSKKINGLKSLKANFSLHLAGNKGKVSDTKKGTVSVKGQKYHVMLGGQEIICDGKTVWTYNKDTKEVQVSYYDPNEQTISPTKLFTNFYDKEYSYSYKGEEKSQGKNCEVVELMPKDKNKQFSKIDLMVDKASHTIAGGNVWEKNGNQYQYQISNFTPDVSIPDSYFAWNAGEHPGVEVVDLR